MAGMAAVVCPVSSVLQHRHPMRMPGTWLSTASTKHSSLCMLTSRRIGACCTLRVTRCCPNALHIRARCTSCANTAIGGVRACAKNSDACSQQAIIRTSCSGPLRHAPYASSTPRKPLASQNSKSAAAPHPHDKLGKPCQQQGRQAACQQGSCRQHRAGILSHQEGRRPLRTGQALHLCQAGQHMYHLLAKPAGVPWHSTVNESGCGTCQGSAVGIPMLCRSWLPTCRASGSHSLAYLGDGILQGAAARHGVDCDGAIGPCHAINTQQVAWPADVLLQRCINGGPQLVLRWAATSRIHCCRCPCRACHWP